jgi:cyclophilin family peptidyl-prolyl cis-trans isomerase
MSATFFKRVLPALLLLGSAAALVATATAQNPPQPKPTHLVIIRTSLGDIHMELFGEDAPKAVKNFVELSKKGYYNGVLFHRVAPGFVIQGGDPWSRDSANKRTVWGRGGTSIYGSTFADELDPRSPSGQIGYKEGIVAMANRGPNTNSSQFFIVLSEGGASHLQYSYTIFGRVTKGMEIVKAIGQLPVDPVYQRQGIPKEPAKMVEVIATEVKPANR